MYDGSDLSSSKPPCMATEPANDDPATDIRSSIIEPSYGDSTPSDAESRNQQSGLPISCSDTGANPVYPPPIDLPLHQRDNLDLKEGTCQDGPQLGARETGEECKDLGAKDISFKDVPLDNAKALLTTDIPPPKRYAHHGKRRRSYTEELFRCQYISKISKSDLVCNALLWKNRPKELRQHLLEHLTVEQIGKMTDDEVTQWFTDAKRIFLQGIPEDVDQEDESETDENGE